MMALLSVTAVTAQTDNRERKAPKEMTPEEMNKHREKRQEYDKKLQTILTEKQMQ